MSPRTGLPHPRLAHWTRPHGGAAPKAALAPAAVTTEYRCFSNNAATNFDGCSAGIVPFRPLAGYCAYHQNTATPTMVFYANMPFEATNSRCQDGDYPNGLISDGEINGGLSHEQFGAYSTRKRSSSRREVPLDDQSLRL